MIKEKRAVCQTNSLGKVMLANAMAFCHSCPPLDSYVNTHTYMHLLSTSDSPYEMCDALVHVSYSNK